MNCAQTMQTLKANLTIRSCDQNVIQSILMKETFLKLRLWCWLARKISFYKRWRGEISNLKPRSARFARTPRPSSSEYLGRWAALDQLLALAHPPVDLQTYFAHQKWWSKVKPKLLIKIVFKTSFLLKNVKIPLAQRFQKIVVLLFGLAHLVKGFHELIKIRIIPFCIQNLPKFDQKRKQIQSKCCLRINILMFETICRQPS